MVYSQRTEEDAEAASRRSNAPYVHMASAMLQLHWLKEQWSWIAGTTELNRTPSCRQPHSLAVWV